MSDPTEFDHYQNYPLCGFCYHAWDIIYGRVRSHTSPDVFLGMCPHAGCDPYIVDYISDETGWPPGWQLDERGVPLAYSDPGRFKLKIPEYNNRVFHMRRDSGPGAAWRQTSQRLLKEGQKFSSKDRESRRVENIFDYEDEEPAMVPVDLDDPDLW